MKRDIADPKHTGPLHLGPGEEEAPSLPLDFEAPFLIPQSLEGAWEPGDSAHSGTGGVDHEGEEHSGGSSFLKPRAAVL